MGNTLKTIIVGFLAGLAGAYAFYQYQERSNSSKPDATYQVTSYSPTDTYKPTVVMPSAAGSLDNVDFSQAAARAIPSVVFVNSISQSGASYSYWDMLFGGNGQPQTQVSSGSGVIFTADGYIVTNNHVVESAEKIQILYNKKVYDAELIGTDPSTDLAVLKIKETNLPAVTLAIPRHSMWVNGWWPSVILSRSLRP